MSMSSRKSYLILLAVPILALVAGGFYWLTVGPQLLGVVLLILGIAALVWLWREWRKPDKA